MPLLQVEGVDMPGVWEAMKEWLTDETVLARTGGTQVSPLLSRSPSIFPFLSFLLASYCQLLPAPLFLLSFFMIHAFLPTSSLPVPLFLCSSAPLFLCSSVSFSSLLLATPCIMPLAILYHHLVFCQVHVVKAQHLV